MQNKVLMRRFPDTGKRRRDYEAPATRSSSVQSSSDPWDIAQLQVGFPFDFPNSHCVFDAPAQSVAQSPIFPDFNLHAWTSPPSSISSSSTAGPLQYPCPSGLSQALDESQQLISLDNDLTPRPRKKRSRQASRELVEEKPLVRDHPVKQYHPNLLMQQSRVNYVQQNYPGQLLDTPIDYFENCSAQDYAVHNLLAQDFAAQSCTVQDGETQHRQVQLAQARDNEAQKHLVQDCATQDCETQDCETKNAQTQDHKPQTKAGPVLTRYLACPFYMSNRHKYHDCLKYELRRVKDVRQHIYRKHTRPDFYCARCFQKFSAAEFRDRHTRELRCQRADDPQFDGISNRQLQLLKSYVSRGRTVEEQWHDTWGIIFPDQPQPKSCYPANHVEETMSQIRALWNQKQSEIIPSVLDDNRGIDVSPVFIDKLMKTIFDRLESQLSGPTVANEATLPATVPRAPLQIVPAAVTDHNVSCQSVGMADFEQSWHLIGSQFANTAEQSSFPTEERLEDGWVADFSYTTGGYYSLFYDSLTELGY